MEIGTEKCATLITKKEKEKEQKDFFLFVCLSFIAYNFLLVI